MVTVLLVLVLVLSAREVVIVNTGYERGRPEDVEHAECVRFTAGATIQMDSVKTSTLGVSVSSRLYCTRTINVVTANEYSSFFCPQNPMSSESSFPFQFLLFLHSMI